MEPLTLSQGPGDHPITGLAAGDCEGVGELRMDDMMGYDGEKLLLLFAVRKDTWRSSDHV